MEKYLNAKDLMTVLGIGRSSAYALLNRKDFPVAHIGKKLVVPETALREWLAQGGTEQREA